MWWKSVLSYLSKTQRFRRREYNSSPSRWAAGYKVPWYVWCVSTYLSSQSRPAGRKLTSSSPLEESGYKLQGFGFQRDLYGFLGGLPMLVLPGKAAWGRTLVLPSQILIRVSHQKVGQVQVKSPRTGEMVYEPVCVSLVGAPGTSIYFLNLSCRW